MLFDSAVQEFGRLALGLRRDVTLKQQKLLPVRYSADLEASVYISAFEQAILWHSNGKLGNSINNKAFAGLIMDS